MRILFKAAIAMVITGISYGVSAEGGWYQADTELRGYVESQYLDDNAAEARININELDRMEPTAAGPSSEQTEAQTEAQIEQSKRDLFKTDMLMQGGRR